MSHSLLFKQRFFLLIVPICGILTFSATLAAQNVGIGLTNPGSKLSVKGNVAIGDGFATHNAPANSLIIEHRLGIGNVNPQLQLDVSGAQRFREESKAASNNIIISSDKSLFRITAMPGNQNNELITNAAVEGQMLTIINEDNNNATFYGNTINGNGGAKAFVYANGVWRVIAAGITNDSDKWSLTGNAGTNSAANFLGTTDSVDLVFRTNNQNRVRITAGGRVGIATTSLPEAELDVNGNISGKGYYHTTGSNPLSIELSRDLPAVGQARTIGFFNLANNAHAIRISVVVSNSDFSASKYYLISMSNNSIAANQWYSITPVSAAKVGNNDFELDLRISTSVVELRLRRTKGTGNGSGAKIRLEYTGSTSAVFTADNTLINPATISGFINNNGNGTGIDAGEFLIEPNTRTAADYYTALSTCGALGGHLCRIDELFHVCDNGLAGVNFTNNVFEWVSGTTSAGGSKAPMMKRNNGNCKNFDEISTNANNVYRCCYYK